MTDPQSDSAPVDREIAAAIPVDDHRLSAAIDRATLQAAAATDPAVRRAFQKVLRDLLDRVPDR